MKSFIFFILLFTMVSCTISFQNIHTNGNASDVVDEEQNVSPNISPDISIPLIPGA